MIGEVESGFGPGREETSPRLQFMEQQQQQQQQEPNEVPPSKQVRVAVEIDKKQDREENGQCPSCGQQLFRLEPVDEVCCLMRCFGKVIIHENGQGDQQLMQKVPLTIPRLVERGQCLNCLNGSRSSTDSSSLGSKTVSTLEDDGPDTMFPHPSMTTLTNNTMNESMNRGGPEDTTTVPSIVSPTASMAANVIQLTPGSLKPPPLTNCSSTATSSFPQMGRLQARSAVIPTGTAVYDGEYNSYGEKHGQGEMRWSNGDVYKGSFVDDVRQGHGTLTFAATNPTEADGGEYAGDWTANQMHGNGTRRYPNGDLYVGEYVSGKRHGEGRFYYANGDLFWGQWKGNHMHGPGRYYYASGQRFEGVFLHSKRNGSGKLQRTDGTLEIFQYVNDQRVGQGVRWSGDRTKAWRLWMPSNGRTGQSGCGSVLEKRSISIAEAVGLVSEIELAAATYAEELLATRTMN